MWFEENTRGKPNNFYKYMREQKYETNQTRRCPKKQARTAYKQQYGE